MYTQLAFSLHDHRLIPTYLFVNAPYSSCPIDIAAPVEGKKRNDSLWARYEPPLEIF